MRGADLIGTTVVDADGHTVGSVHDLRLAAGVTPTADSGRPAYGISGLVVGPVAVSQRLGYGRGQMSGPWPLTSLFRWLARRSYVVDWADVVERSPKQLRLGVRQADLRSVLEVHPERDESGAGRST
ncbi:MAG TPA: hypothetical protein VFJ12_11575 [Segeticoccus sp.]|nr:hypothetical protein [Segeticoccus sp.]